MSGLTLEDLLDKISENCFKTFPLEFIQGEKFIPINKTNEALYLGMVDAGLKERREPLLSKITQEINLKPKVIPLTNEQFEKLFAHCAEKFNLIDKEPLSNEQESVPSLPQPQSPDKPKTPDNNNEQSSQQFAPQQSAQPPQDAKPKRRLGEQLIDDGLITQDQLEKALAESKESKTPVGSALVKLGFITLEQLKAALADQQGVNYVTEKELTISDNVISLLPEEFIRFNKVVPIETDGKNIQVGMVDPNNKRALNDIIYLTGLSPKPMILTHIEFEKCIENYFKTKKETEKLMEVISEEESSGDEDSIWSQVEKELQDESSNVAKFVSSLIQEALDKKASDIHIEPRLDHYIVRFRVDGILRKVLEVPAKIESMVISRFKVIAKMDIAEHRRPQDGHTSIKIGDRLYDLRLNTLPVGAKEKLCIRILQPSIRMSTDVKKIELVGATSNDIQKIEIMTTSPHGIIFVTGPTGSGKTTTLYSVLNKVNEETVNITTVEDPVEIKVEGINQVQVNAKADVTFAACLRAILRQDPDVIMIGEIRDFETLESAIHAALTGHLVLSTLHTNSATATVTRLIEMGAASHLIASAVVGIVAQRLLRRLCPACKELYTPELEELKMIVSQSEEMDVFREKGLYRPVGCDACGNTGFVGRMGIYEIMTFNREIRKLITHNAANHEIEEVAVSTGMKTLQRAGLDAVFNGEVPIKEYIRILGALSE